MSEPVRYADIPQTMRDPLAPSTAPPSDEHPSADHGDGSGAGGGAEGEGA